MASVIFPFWKLLVSQKTCLFLLVYFPCTIVIAAFGFWIYLSTEQISNLVTISQAVTLDFDFIIVGGGTAGCVLASRLSENPDINVLLIEAGNTFSPMAMVPLFASQQQKTSTDWQLETTPQKHSSIGCKKQVTQEYSLWDQRWRFSYILASRCICWNRFSFCPEGKD